MAAREARRLQPARWRAARIRPAEAARQFVRLLGSTGREIATTLTGGARRRARTLGVIAVTAGAYLDKWPIQRAVHRLGDGTALRLATFGDAAGDVRWLIGVGALALVVGLCTGRRPLVEAALVLAAAGLWCWALTETGRAVLAERRPSDGGAMRFFAGGGHGVSGHAACAALWFWPLWGILARRARPGVRTCIGLGLLGWAAFIGWSRVWLGMHFLWNVLLGLSLGFAAGGAALRARAARDGAR